LVVGFESRTDAERFVEQFRERLAKFGLELHADKTRLIEFGRNAARNRKQRGQGKPETFTFLGFTHYCGKRRSDGSFIVWRKTAKKRMGREATRDQSRVSARQAGAGPAGRGVGEEGPHRLLPVSAIPGNLDRLSVFRRRLRRLWR